MASEQPAFPEPRRPGLLSLAGLRNRLFGGAAGNVFRGMVVLATGTIAARVVGLASIPVLTRIYSPEDYGVLAVFTALVAILVPILTLRYVVAVPLPRHDGMAMNLMVLSAGLLAVMSIIVGLLLWAFGPALLGLMSMDALVHWWWLIVVGLIGTGAYEILSMWATRRRAYKPIAQTQFTQSILGAVVKIGLGLLAFKPLGLLLGQIGAQSGGIGSLSRRFWTDFRANLRFVDIRRLWFAAKRYRDFPHYRLPSQFLLVFSQQAPLIFVAHLYGAETTGQFGLALMSLALPMALFGQAIGKAYYAEIAHLRNGSGDILQITYIVQKRLFAIAVPVALTIFLFGPMIFENLFGEEWSKAGFFASVLSVYILLQFTSSPLIQALNVFGGQGKFLIINMLRSSVIIAIYVIFHIYRFDENHFIYVYSGFMFLFYGFVSCMIIRIIKISTHSH